MAAEILPGVFCNDEGVGEGNRVSGSMANREMERKKLSSRMGNMKKCANCEHRYKHLIELPCRECKPVGKGEKTNG